MADGLNKVQLIGNLGADPEYRAMDGEKEVANIRLATSESWRDDQGNKTESVEWHRVVFWGKQASVVRDHFKKGMRVYVEGKNKTRKWTDAQGVEKYTTEVIGSRFLFLDSKSSGSNQSQNNNGGNNKGQQSGPPAGSFDGNDDDIPF